MPAALDVLIPTRDRVDALVMTLAGVAAQQQGGLRVVVADQGARPVGDEPVVRTLRRVIEARGGVVEWHVRRRRHGPAEQRGYLLGQAQAAVVLFLDDDVLMEAWVAATLRDVLVEEGCGFVGAFPVGLSYREDVRPEQQRVEWWEGPVGPELLEAGSDEWLARAQVHRAANLLHVAAALPPGPPRRYRVSWVGACVAYDRAKLEAVGGFGFWPRLPVCHSGEDVVVQHLLQRRFGGCGIAPSGTYHAEVPSVVLNAAGGVDGHALDLLPELLADAAATRP